jgi:hypothetical protein
VELSVQGTTYRVLDAILPSNPGPLATDTDDFNCQFFRRSFSGTDKATRTKPGATDKGNRATTARMRMDPSRAAPGKVWKVGFADVAMGTMTVVGPHGDGSIASGLFEYVGRYDTGDDIPPEEITLQEAGDQPVLREPYSIGLKFYEHISEY